MTVKCASFWDALVLGLMLEEQGAEVHRKDEVASLTIGASGPLDRIRAAVAQLHHEFPRSGTVTIENENGDEVTGGAQPVPATGAAAQEQSPASAERADGGHRSRGRTTGGDPDQPLDIKVVIVPGETRYHRRGCPLIRLLGNDDLKTSTRQQAEADRCMPCQACKPDRPLRAQT